MNKVFRVTWVNSEPQLTLWLLSLLERLVVLNMYECKNPWQVGNWVDYFSQDLDEEWTDWEDEEKRKSSGKSWKRFAQKWHLNVYLCYFFFKINLSIFIFLSTPWRLNGLDRTCVTQIRHRVSIQKNINFFFERKPNIFWEEPRDQFRPQFCGHHVAAGRGGR